MKRFLCLLTVLALALSVLPGAVMAEFESVLLSSDTVIFDSYDAAFDGIAEAFTTETNGEVTVYFMDCAPGYYMELYADGDLRSDYVGYVGDKVIFSVTAGVEYEVLLCSYDLDANDFAEGYLKYEISFLSNGETPDLEPEDPSLIPGGTPENPLPMNGSYSGYINSGKTVWFLYDNTQNMNDNGVYSMMLHVSSGAGYTATFNGQELPVDEIGFLNYEMEDTGKTGLYLFSITNPLTENKFFSITVEEKPIYIILDQELNVGSNRITLNSEYPYTLLQFSPSQTGIYQIRANQCRVGDFGTIYNPMDNTPNKTNTITWTCTAVGQSLLVSFSGPKSTTCTVIRTGDYVPPVEIPWTFYENTYDFSYEIDADATVQDIDLMDGNQHDAVLGADGFYHYGSAEGPLMVADLSTIEINLTEAYANGGLRAWLLDENRQTISKVDYNEAMNQYLQAGLVPVTQELTVMLQEIGISHGWWVAGSILFPEAAPENTDNAWMHLCGYLVENQGVNVSGAVVTGANGDVIIELLRDDAVIDGITVLSEDGTYTLEGVAEGSYVLRISQVNHVTREYSITVDSEDLTQDVKIHLIGDIDGNGKINMGDVAKLNSHIKNTTPLTDEYQLLCANVNGGSLNMGDTAALYAHVKNTKPLF